MKARGERLLWAFFCLGSLLIVLLCLVIIITRFIPRFDRHVTKRGVERYGLESLCSVARIAEFGQAIPQLRLCETFLPYVTDPTKELLEYLKRDILNIAMGNTDNHARNTALIKYPNARVELSPLFDFSPMILDPEGVVRMCKWGAAESGGKPEWSEVLRLLESHLSLPIHFVSLRRALKKWAPAVAHLPTLMDGCGVDHALINYLKSRIQMTAESLEKCVS